MTAICALEALSSRAFAASAARSVFVGSRGVEGGTKADGLAECPEALAMIPAYTERDNFLSE
jgi:hypothetical protein